MLEANAMKLTNLMPIEQEMRAAITARDATYEGLFVFGLMTTGIFWRLSCSVRSAQPENLCFFADPDSAAERQPLPKAAKILSLSAARFQRAFKSAFGVLPKTHQVVGSAAMQAAISE
jgi:AraC family transcriptional regulator of adaptative response/methylated-DNA-[protein]-cysteine methyltransferase